MEIYLIPMLMVVFVLGMSFGAWMMFLDVRREIEKNGHKVKIKWKN
ncbi:hypothetical protein [Oceanobacillus kimchii]|uniref:Uncharacterized protein n=1 Tax=Oceanobacillus kimchii TaxID=746691 RepID=A0ABQ5TJD6_9BACI|nr:hypothetical protein [Oceanobacillus kimchii]GLO66272.1 hypothetical protein MACH08_20560 [Oceanobacillus kimchii]